MLEYVVLLKKKKKKKSSYGIKEDCATENISLAVYLVAGTSAALAITLLKISLPIKHGVIYNVMQSRTMQMVFQFLPISSPFWNLWYE